MSEAGPLIEYCEKRRAVKAGDGRSVVEAEACKIDVFRHLSIADFVAGEAVIEVLRAGDAMSDRGDM